MAGKPGEVPAVEIDGVNLRIAVPLGDEGDHPVIRRQRRAAQLEGDNSGGSCRQRRLPRGGSSYRAVFAHAGQYNRMHDTRAVPDRQRSIDWYRLAWPAVDRYEIAVGIQIRSIGA